VWRCSCGNAHVGTAASAVPPSAARRSSPRVQPEVEEPRSAPKALPFENRPPRLYKSQYGPSARQPHPRPHSPAPRPHHHRRRPALGCSSRSSPLHEPPSLPKPGSVSSSSRHRSSRSATATSPPPRSSPLHAIFHPARFLHPRTTPPKRPGRNLRHSRRIRRPPPPQPSRNADRRPGRRSLLRDQRHNRAEIPPQTPSLKRAGWRQ
jgi:hypothetical protein